MNDEYKVNHMKKVWRDHGRELNNYNITTVCQFCTIKIARNSFEVDWPVKFDNSEIQLWLMFSLFNELRR